MKTDGSVKAHTGDGIRELSGQGEPLVITLHGEAVAVLQDIASYEQAQETLALLKMLAMSGKSLEEGRLRPVGQAFADIRKRVKS